MTPWFLVARYDLKEVERQRNLLINNIYVFIIILLFIIILAYYISFVLLKPMNKINRIFCDFRLDGSDKNELDVFS